MATDYTVKLNIFEGPLDLLLHLIKVNEMEIGEISISEITSQYLDYLALMEKLDLEVAGDFLVMAATLLNIKLRALLPAAEVEEEDEEEVDHFLSARALMQQLIEYRKFKEAATELGQRSERQARIFLREVALPKLAEARKDPEILGDLNQLLEAFTRVLMFVQRRDYHQVQEEEYHVEDKINWLRRQLLLEPRLSLQEIFLASRSKIEMAVTLIAVLELCRLHELRISQSATFGEVYLFHKQPDESLAGSESAELERIEADILAHRTGLVDDGLLPDEDEDVLLDKILDEADRNPQAPAAQTGANLESPAGADQPSRDEPEDTHTPAGALIIDIAPPPDANDAPPPSTGVSLSNPTDDRSERHE